MLQMQTLSMRHLAWGFTPEARNFINLPKVITIKSNRTHLISRAQDMNHTNDETTCDMETPKLTSRRDALSTALTGSISLAAGVSGGLLSPLPAAATSPSLTTSPAVPITTAREAKMVMRVTALRGSVPASWVQDFSTAMEGYGIVALTQKPQVADVWQELKGEAQNVKKKKSKKQPKPTTVDAVTLGDAWLAAAIAQGLIQPIQGAKEHRYWVS